MGHLLNGSMVGLVATSSMRIYATCCMTQVCCTQSPCPCSRPLLTCTSARDTQTLKGKSGSISVGPMGPGSHKVLSESSERLWQVWSLILNAILPLLPSWWGFSFALGYGVSIYGEIQHSPVGGYSAVSCNFGVLSGEDEHTLFYCTILCVRRRKRVNRRQSNQASNQIPKCSPEQA